MSPAIVQTLDGKNVSIYSFLVKKSIVMFFWTDCSHCKNEITDILSLYPVLKDSMNIVGISFSGKEQTVDFIITSGIKFPVFRDVNWEAKNSFHANVTPSIFFVDSRQRLVKYKFGEQSKKQLGAMLLWFANITPDSTLKQL